MNAIGQQDTLNSYTKSLADPFNYPSLNRDMVMSMQTITTRNDHVKTNTQRFVSPRGSSQNLDSSDIPGKWFDVTV